MSELILEMKNITKTFGKVVANENVNLELYAGEIHALLGENGAGKSTLMNVLTGIYKADAGQIFYKGKEVQIRSPKHAVAMGIGMVHQHFRLIPTLSVAENVYLYSDNRSFFLKEKEMEQVIAECSKAFNLEVDASAKVWQLSVGEQQRVEIIKLLYRGAEILILDEPSAVLTPQEADDMFRTLRKMAQSGKAVIVISHKMNEVMNHADRITVLKGGKVEDSMLAKDATIDRLTKAVVGERGAAEPKLDSRGLSEEKVLEVQNLGALDDKGLPAITDITLDIRKGEIFGIAGVAGNGQRELAEAIAGLRPTTGGRILIHGEDVTRMSVRNRIKNGTAFIPEDRLHQGLVPAMNMMANVVLENYDKEPYSKHGFLKPQVIDRTVDEYIQKYDIKNGGPELPVSLMSGGNQQKLLVAREIAGEPDLIIAAYPVRGLDIGAVAAIHEILLEQSARGASILLISEELDEIFEMCHRVAALCDGQIMGIRDVADTTYEELGQMIAGHRTGGTHE